MWKVSYCDTKDKVWCFMSGVWSKAIQGNQWCREYSWSILVCETLLNFGKKNISTNNLFSHDIYRKTVIKWYICTVPHNWDIFFIEIYYIYVNYQTLCSASHKRCQFQFWKLFLESSQHCIITILYNISWEKSKVLKDICNDKKEGAYLKDGHYAIQFFILLIKHFSFKLKDFQLERAKREWSFLN